MEDLFFKRFKKIILWGNICSIYLPGLKPLKIFNIKLNIPYIFCVVTVIVPFLQIIDNFFLIFFLSTSMMAQIQFVLLTFNWVWSFSKRILFLSLIKRVEDIAHFWSLHLQPSLWPEIRDEFLQKRYEKIMKCVYLGLCMVLGPMLAVSFTKLFYTGAIFFDSSLNDKYSFYMIIVHCITVLSINASWIGSEAFVALLLNMVVSDLTYLKVALGKILYKIRCAKNEGDQSKALKEAEKQLGLWVNYHGNVIRFVSLVQLFYEPLLAGHFLHITIAISGIIRNSIVAGMPIDVMFLSYVYAMPRIILTYVICGFADEIVSLGTNLGFPSEDWVGLPPNILKDMQIIDHAVQRPILLKVTGVFSLNVNTFRKAMVLFYRFLTFMFEMNSRTNGKV